MITGFSHISGKENKSPAKRAHLKKGDIIKAQLVSQGRFPNEMLAVANDRLISVPNCHQDQGFVKLKIKRTKHNLFLGILV